MLCRQHFLLGDVVLETKSDGFVAAGGDGAVSGGVGAASLGPTAVFSLFGWPSRGLGPVDVLTREPPMVAVVVWRASGSWWRLGSPLLNDDAIVASPILLVVSFSRGGAPS